MLSTNTKESVLFLGDKANIGRKEERNKEREREGGKEGSFTTSGLAMTS